MRVDTLAKGSLPDSFWNDPVLRWDFRVASTLGVYAFASFFLAIGGAAATILALAGALLVALTLFRPLRWQMWLVALAGISASSLAFVGPASPVAARLCFAIAVLLILFVRPWRPRRGPQDVMLTIGALLAGVSCAAFLLDSIPQFRDAVLLWPVPARFAGITPSRLQIASVGALALLAALIPLVWRHARGSSYTWSDPLHGAAYGAMVGLCVAFLPLYMLPSRIAVATRFARDKDTVFITVRGPAWELPEPHILDEILRRRLVVETIDLHRSKPVENHACRAVEAGGPDRIEHAQLRLKRVNDDGFFSELYTWNVRGTPGMVDEVHRFLTDEGSMFFRHTLSPAASTVERCLFEGWALALSRSSPTSTEMLREAIRQARDSLRSLPTSERRVIERKIAYARYSLPLSIFGAENPGLIAAYQEVLDEFIGKCISVRSDAAFAARDQLKNLHEYLGYCSQVEFEQMLAAARASVAAISEEDRVQGLIDSVQTLLESKDP